MLLHFYPLPSRDLLVFVLLLLLSTAHVAARITLKDISALTNLTAECREEIRKVGSVAGLVDLRDMGRAGDGAVGQAVLGGDGDEDGEVEDTVAASLKTLDSRLVEMLNVPLETTEKTLTIKEVSCPTVLGDYHSFIEATALFLRAVEEQQQLHRWGGVSPVFDGITWLQALWASRSVNEQNRSFIEQQMILYGSTTCLGTHEVLRRGVELVEYMNDLIDSFDS